MEQPIFFFVGLSFILTHEMDAIKSREWVMFPLTSRLDEKTGYLVFIIAHIPLYLVLFLALFSPNGLNRGLMMGLDIFFIIHVFLHLLFLRHPKNEFKTVISWVIILGAGIAGLLDLVVGS